MWSTLVSPLLGEIMNISPNHPNVANPATASALHGEPQWRRVAGRERWGKIQLYDISGVH